MNITEMPQDDFTREFIAALLRSGAMKEKDIVAAFKEAKQYLTKACLLQMLIDGKINARWDGKQLLWTHK